MWCSHFHDDVIKWKHFPRNWPFVRGIHRSPVNSPHKGQWRGALMLSLVCVWINDWANNREACDLKSHRVHYDVIVMWWHYTHTSVSELPHPMTGSGLGRSPIRPHTMTGVAFWYCPRSQIVHISSAHARYQVLEFGFPSRSEIVPVCCSHSRLQLFLLIFSRFHRPAPSLYE